MDVAGVQRHGERALGSLLVEPPLELLREEHVGELGLAVPLPRRVERAVHGLDAVEVHAVLDPCREVVSARGDLDDAHGGGWVFGGLDEQRNEWVREGEVAEVVGLELDLEAVLGELVGCRHDTSVVDL